MGINNSIYNVICPQTPGRYQKNRAHVKYFPHSSLECATLTIMRSFFTSITCVDALKAMPFLWARRAVSATVPATVTVTVISHGYAGQATYVGGLFNTGDRANTADRTGHTNPSAQLNTSRSFLSPAFS